MKKIIHIDMDCFYAAVECRDDPSVADKPVAVSGQSGRSVLTTCNYEARKFGCRSAMPLFKALKLCPHLVVKPIRSDVYRAESKKIRAIFAQYAEKIEPLSLDEAFLDVSHRPEYAWNLAKMIRKDIWESCQLTASAGISFNKMLAKIASDWKKPNGQFAVTPDQVEEFMRELPLRKIPGVGPKSEAKLKGLGFVSCGELQAVSLEKMYRLFGSTWGPELYKLCRGEDDREVDTSRFRKSMSNEETYREDLKTLEACEAELPELVDALKADLEKRSDKEPIWKLYLKLKFSDFKTTTRECLGDDVSFFSYADLLRDAFDRNSNPVRLMGVGVKFREPENGIYEQLEILFGK